jgi:hypothetical protein
MIYIIVGKSKIPARFIKQININNQLIYGHACNIHFKDNVKIKHITNKLTNNRYPEIVPFVNNNYIMVDFFKDYNSNSNEKLNNFINDCKTKGCNIEYDLDYNLYFYYV